LGSFSGYAASALNLVATGFSVHDATLEGLDVTFNNFVGLNSSQFAAGGFLNVIAGRDIVYDGVAVGGTIGTAANPFSQNLTLTAGRNILLGTGIYTGTGVFTIASNQAINTSHQNITAGQYTDGGDVMMYG